MFASTCLAEKGVEGIVPTTDGLVTGHLAIRLDPVLQTVQLPTGIAHLDTGLANMDADTFTLKKKGLHGHEQRRHAVEDVGY